jgi:hypothetical protein
MTPSIEITVSPAGQITVQTTGFAGPSCRDASRLLELALGKQASEQLTAEFHQSAHEQAVRIERL